jgi:5-methylcytosine-specific restriction endonuclease McrA
MTRLAEFSKATKREALKRSHHRCEAEGERYGLPAGQRCGADLAYGIEFDHVIMEANSHDNSLENCAAVCPKCHRFKTSNFDVPCAAKARAQQDKRFGIKPKHHRPMPGSRASGIRKRMSGQVERWD